MKPSDLKLKLHNHEYQGRPFYGVTATIRKLPDTTSGPYKWVLTTLDQNGNDHREMYISKRTMAECLTTLDSYGDVMVKTTNILNPDAGEFDIPLRDKGGCCDPGTERYHSM